MMLLVATARGAYAQDAADPQGSPSDGGATRALSIVPRISVTETITDNARLASTNQQADQITDFSPGLRVTSSGARVKGYLDYSLHELYYAQDAARRTTQNSLNAFGTVEAIENWAYLDFSGGISQQAISAFGTQSVGNTAANANLTETSSFRLSPYVRGRLGSAAEYQVRYTLSTIRSKSSLVSDATSEEGLVRVGSGSAIGLFGWSLEASQQNISYSPGRSYEADRLRAVLTYAVSPQFHLSAIGGSEANNYTSVDKERHGSGGVGMDWNPTERTRLSASRENRYFGEGHSVSIEHRTPLTVWRFSDVRDVFSTPTQSGIGVVGTMYDLVNSLFTSIEPDPVKRAQLVNQFFQANPSISPTGAVISNFLTSAVMVQRRQSLSLSLLGARDTVTFMYMRTESNRLSSLTTFLDDFTNSAVIIQHGFNVSYAHRLTEQSSLNLLVSQQNTSGSLDVQETTLRHFNLSVSTVVGPQTRATVGFRRVVFDSISSPYIESAIFAGLTVQF